MNARIWISVVLLALCACAPRARSWTPPQSPEAMDDDAFLHYLSTVPVATVDEAGRGLLLVVEPDPPRRTPQERMIALQDRGLVRRAWGLKPEHVLTRGVLAFMLWKACGLPGGVSGSLLPRWGIADQRYAIRACDAAGLLEYGAPDESINGGELVAAIREADAWLERNAAAASRP